MTRPEMSTCFINDKVKPILSEDVQVVDQYDFVAGSQLQALGSDSRTK